MGARLMHPLTCAQAREYIEARAVDAEAPVDELALQHHLMGCASCPSYVERLRNLPQIMDVRALPPLPTDPAAYFALHRQVAARRQHPRHALTWSSVRLVLRGALTTAVEIAVVLLFVWWLASGTQLARVMNSALPREVQALIRAFSDFVHPPVIERPALPLPAPGDTLLFGTPVAPDSAAAAP